MMSKERLTMIGSSSKKPLNFRMQGAIPKWLPKS